MIVRTLLFRQKCTGNNTASLVSASSYSHFSDYLLQCHTGWQILNARPGHYFQQIPRKWPQAHLVLRGAHLQVLQSGDILYDQCLLMNLNPHRRPTAAQPSPEYPRTSPQLRKIYHIHAKAPRLQTTVEEVCESQARTERTKLLHVSNTGHWHPARSVRAFQ